VLSNSIFTTLGAVGSLNPDFFHIGTSAHDADDRIIFNASNGALYYDADGDGSTALQVQCATIAASSALASSDFIVGA
jgi:Ca2+-binding RTX toxin-like protein